MRLFGKYDPDRYFCRMAFGLDRIVEAVVRSTVVGRSLPAFLWIDFYDDPIFGARS